MQIMKVSNKWGAYSWSTGFVSRKTAYDQEAKKHPEAVINRLMREGRWDEAEEVMDKYLKVRRC